MQLAAKNSPAFQRANVRRAERMQQIEDLKTEITALEKELAQAQSELEVAKQEYEERSLNPPNPPTLKKGDFQDYYRYRLNEIQNRFIAVKRALMAMGWLQGADGISLMDTLSSHAVVYQAKDTRIMKDGTWKLYKMGERGTWSPVKEFVDKRNNGYVETPREFARKIDKAAV
jgi:hypothetical protein